MVLDKATDGDLRAVYYAFCSFGGQTQQSEMEGKTFVKLAKDCKLLTKTVTTTDMDLIFTKIKAKGARKIGYDQFLLGLDQVAAKKGCSLDAVVQAIIGAGGPVDGGTKAEAVRFHDDKSLYTGVYAKGGPTNVDMDPANLASVLDRSPADVRGVKTSSSGSSPGGSRRGTTDMIGARRTTGESRRSTTEAARRSTTEGLKNLKL